MAKAHSAALHVCLVWLAVAGFLFDGCSLGQKSAQNQGSPPEAAPSSLTYEKKAIVLRIFPADTLNRFEGRKHTLILAVYQLDDPTCFHEKSTSRQGLGELLRIEGKQASFGVLTCEKTVVYPGRPEVITLDRAEHAQYIGIIAAYYDLNPEQVSALFKIESVQDKKTGLARFNPFTNPPPPRPARLEIRLELGGTQMEHVAIKAS